MTLTVGRTTASRGTWAELFAGSSPTELGCTISEGPAVATIAVHPWREWSTTVETGRPEVVSRGCAMASIKDTKRGALLPLTPASPRLR
jgi:hypothetical protein